MSRCFGSMVGLGSVARKSGHVADGRFFYARQGSLRREFRAARLIPGWRSVNILDWDR